MKKINNSQPLAVATQFRSLSTSMQIIALGGLSMSQFYKQTSLEWYPDHSAAIEYEEGTETQTNGTLRLSVNYSVIDPDGIIDTDELSPQIFWYVDGTQVTSIDQNEDYYISSNVLYVKKNFTHTQGATVYCECKFTDPRTKAAVVMSDTATLSAILQADEQWSLSILNDKTSKHYPLSAETTEYTFNAEAYLALNKREDVAWFWDYSLDNGMTWQEIDDTCYWYVSGKNTASLTIDMDFVELITVRVRIATDTEATAPDLPNAATATCAWRTPQLYPAVYCKGGDKVLPDTAFMTFGVFVHVSGHDDLTEDQVAEWLMFDWGMREQGSTASATSLDCHDPECAVPAAKLFNYSNKKYIVEPGISLRGVYDVLADSDGELLAGSDGNLLFARS